MTVKAKICGLNSPDSIAAAVEGGADYIGLVFYPPSPRFVTPHVAAELAEYIPPTVKKVGLFVDADDDFIAEVLGSVALDMLQLHGSESPERVDRIKARFRLPVMKAVKVAGPEDIEAADAFVGHADMLLFDAKAPKNMFDALPGGNGLVFDWRLLGARDFTIPWMLSGGLDDSNVAEAVAISGAGQVDVSSGVEDRPGVKSPARIKAFLDAVRAIDAASAATEN